MPCALPGNFRLQAPLSASYSPFLFQEPHICTYCKPACRERTHPCQQAATKRYRSLTLTDTNPLNDLSVVESQFQRLGLCACVCMCVCVRERDAYVSVASTRLHVCVCVCMCLHVNVSVKGCMHVCPSFLIPTVGTPTATSLWP